MRSLGSARQFVWLVGCCVVAAALGCVYSDPGRAKEALQARGIVPTWVQPWDRDEVVNRPDCPSKKYLSCTGFTARGEHGETVHGSVMCAPEGACDVVVEVPMPARAANQDGGR